MEVVVPRAPAPLELDVFAIDLPVRMNFDRAVVGVVTAYDHPSAVSHHVEALLDRVGGAARFDHNVDAAAAGQTAHGFETAIRREIEAECRCRAHFSSVVEAVARRADCDDLA